MTKVIPYKFQKLDLAESIQKAMRRIRLNTFAMENETKAQITLLGIGSAKDRALKANLMSVLEAADLDVDVREVSDISQILNYGVSGIPALLLDEKVIFQKIVPSVEELNTALTELLKHRKSRV